MENTTTDTDISSKKRPWFRLSQVAKLSFPLLLGIAILYFLYRRSNWAEMWTTIRDANWWILTASLIFGLAANVVRGIRWKLLIDPLGYKTKRLNLVYAVLGNYAVNFVIPRAGEVWRCTEISKVENIPVKNLVGSLILDRVFDTVMVILLTVVAFLSNISLFLRKGGQFFDLSFLTNPYLYFVLLLVIIALVAVFVLFRNTRFIRIVTDFVKTTWNDIKAAWTMKRSNKLLFVFYTLFIWMAYFTYFYITFYAFDFTSSLTLSAGLFVFVMGSISMGVPSNGGLGPWQAAVVLALTALNIRAANAAAFATAVFVFQSLWVAICGLWGIGALSLAGNREKTPTKISTIG